MRKIGKKIKLVQTDEQEEPEPEPEPIIILNSNIQPSTKNVVKKKPRKLVIQEE